MNQKVEKREYIFRKFFSKRPFSRSLSVVHWPPAAGAAT